MTQKPFAASTERNSLPILEVIRREFEHASTVLEIGSGTGQHAVCFGKALNHLDWQTSELVENHAAIHAWLDEAGLPNVSIPIELDVMTADVSRQGYDAVFSANTAHIMSYGAVVKMFSLIGKALREDGVFCLYGPFRQGDEFNTQSNADFDRSLRERNSEMGIRDIEALDKLGESGGMVRERLYAMPANNCLAVWRKRAAGISDGNT
jgi:cyclopropane fatty-acyl-phospholipid synthase-like methyltransferase